MPSYFSESKLSEPITDALGRSLKDLRISVIDACNFRCSYCMPAEVFGKNFTFLKSNELLSFEEIARLGTICAQLGVKKIRLTGGEPLLRKNIEDLIALLVQIPGIEDIALTTNAFLLAQKAKALKKAGLKRITVSLDSLRPEAFKIMTGFNQGPERVLEGIKVAQEIGFSSIKVNMVVKKGINEEDIVPIAKFFKGTGIILRFIEFMDVGTTNGWNFKHVVSADEIVARIHNEMPIKTLALATESDVALRYGYEDGQGEIGIIASVSRPFCGNCVRARISADGTLYTCLFATQGTNLKTFLRANKSNNEIKKIIRTCWQKRDDRYSEQRDFYYKDKVEFLNKVEMFKVGG